MNKVSKTPSFKSLRSRILSLVGSLVVFIILSLSIINFLTVRKTLLNDIRTNQLISFMEASQSDIQMVIEKAIETSILLAEDPLIIKWFNEGETNNTLGQIVKDKLKSVSVNMGYFTVFAINSVTNNYWVESGKMLDVLDENDAEDGWFFSFLTQGKKVTLNFDYNPEMDQTLFFFNALIGTPEAPGGTAGVGLNPTSIINEFNKKKLTENSRLWLIDSEGHIQISANEEEIGKDITELLPASVTSDVLDKSNKKVITDKKWNEEGFEFAKMKVGTTDFIILIAAPTDELTILLNPIRYNAIILGIVFFIFTLFIVYLLTNSISKPLVNITTLAGNFATGNLTQPIKSELLSRSDEIGNLSRAFKEMKNQISKMILQVKHSAQIVSEGSAVLTQSSHKLSSSATQQASATEEVSASMEEMSSNITQNAENAKITEDIMSKATTDTERGGEIVIKTVDAIKNINENVRIIEDIAMQTNLLALNAAVEAARAGEHGKGFAVVASEVRKLAERSRESALKINELSGSSVEIAERAGEIFTNLVPGVKKSFSLVGEISAASNEQDIGANQVNNAIMELDKVSQSNAAAAENISQLTTEFVNEVNKLQMAIRFFQVEENQSIAGIELANNNKENF